MFPVDETHYELLIYLCTPTLWIITFISTLHFICLHCWFIFVEHILSIQLYAHICFYVIDLKREITLLSLLCWVYVNTFLILLQSTETSSLFTRSFTIFQNLVILFWYWLSPETQYSARDYTTLAIKTILELFCQKLLLIILSNLHFIHRNEQAVEKSKKMK